MKVYKTRRFLKANIAKAKKKGLSIGFVPTMGALHDGHLSLIKAAKENCDIVVCSVFVNPTQFDNQDDLVKYPRTFESDSSKLKTAGCDVIFYPSLKAIYPDGSENFKAPDVGPIVGLWEGEFRTGHFEGMMQVVSILLKIVAPDMIFMGQKDYQQLAIVKRMVDVWKMKVEVVGKPIVREESGLAMSSRNVRLSKESRKNAAVLNQTLKWIEEQYAKFSIEELQKKAIAKINAVSGFEVEYLAIVDRKTMERATSKKNAVAVLVARIEGVRLLDNRELKL